MARERDFQSHLIKRLRRLFPGCIILKNDPNYLQGFPDLTILFNDMWAVLEDKSREDARHQPNQDHYISMLNRMSFAAFIYPENEEEVIHELQQAFGISRSSRVLVRE